MSRTQTLRILSLGMLSAVCGSSFAYQQGDVLVRLGPALVNPNSDSGEVLGVGKVAVEDKVGVGFTATYLFNEQFGVELLASLPFKHELQGRGGLDAIGKLGDVKHLPPTVTLQWYPKLTDLPVQPYVGLGLNYTFFFDEQSSGKLDSALGNTDISLNSSWGWAVQVGLDVPIQGPWFANAALWYIDIDTKAHLDFDGGPATGGAAGHTSVHVNIDPWVAMLAVGYRF